VKKKEKVKEDEEIIKRLDAILYFLIEISYSLSNKKHSEANIAKTLYSVGMSPTEIAHLLGKKSRVSIAPYIYGRKK